MIEYCNRQQYPHPPHDPVGREHCPGQPPESEESLTSGWRPEDGMTDEARKSLRARKDG